MTRFAPLFTGACTLALAGGAYAGDPLTLTAAQLDGVTAGQIEFSEFKQIFVDVFKSYAVFVELDGTSAESTGQATAVSFNGEDVLAEVANYTAVVSDGPIRAAEAAGTSISAVDTH